MRLTDIVSDMVDTALANQALPGETFHHEVFTDLIGWPGGEGPQLTIVIVGVDGDTPVTAPAAAIINPSTGRPIPIATQSVVDAHVATALTWIRVQ